MGQVTDAGVWDRWGAHDNSRPADSLHLPAPPGAVGNQSADKENAGPYNVLRRVLLVGMGSRQRHETMAQ